MLLRAVRGEIVLPSVAVPSLDPVDPVATNGVRVTGGGVAAGTAVHLFLDDTLVATTVVAGGGFEADLLLAADGAHELVAVAEVAGQHSGPSAVATFQSADAGPTYGSAAATPIPEIPAGETAVWFPRAGGEPYEIQGTLTVVGGGSLTIHPAAVVEFGPGAELVASGQDAELVIAGAAAPDRVQLVPEGGATTRGFWEGIRIDTGAQAAIDHAVVAYAARGVEASGETTSLVLTGSEIHGFLDASQQGWGVAVASEAQATIQGNLVHNGGWDPQTRLCAQGDGYLEGQGIRIVATDAAPLVADNDVVCVDQGLWVQSAAPLVQANGIESNATGIFLDVGGDAAITGGNEITANTVWGIRVAYGDPYPHPIITGNAIHANGSFNLSFEPRGSANPHANNTSVPAEDNWWGTTDSAAIAASIDDLHDHPLDPGSGGAVGNDPRNFGWDQKAWVDWVPFRDGPDGDLMLGTHLIGDMQADLGDPDSPLVMQPDTVYKAFRSFRVVEGTTVTIPRGVTIQVEKHSRVRIRGTLIVAGEMPDPDLVPDPALGGVLFTSAEPVPAPGDWWAVDIDKATVDAAFVTIEYARHGIEHDRINEAGSLTLRDSVVRELQGGPLGEDPQGTRGIWFERKGSILLERNEILGDCNDPGGIGIEFVVTGGQPDPSVIADNVVRCFKTGMQVAMSGPLLTIRDNLVEQNSSEGVYVRYLANDETLAEFTGNVIRQNGTGLRLRNPWTGVPMTGNDISANTRNLWVTNPNNVFSVLDLSQNYWGEPTPADVFATFDLEFEDPSRVVVDFSDFLLDPQGTSSIGTGHASYVLKMVNRAPVKFAPGAGENAEVQVELRSDSNVLVRICDDIRASTCDGTNALRTLGPLALPENAGGPPHLIDWDGRDSGGEPVPPSAYIFSVEAVAQAIPAIVSRYEPNGGSDTISMHQEDEATFTPQGSMNIFENRFFVGDLNLQSVCGDCIRWIFVDIRPESGTFPPGCPTTGDPTPEEGACRVMKQYLLPGDHKIVWDGRFADGSYIQEPIDWLVFGHYVNRPNYFIVGDGAPEVLSPHDPPVVEIRSNPFLVYHSYEQVSRVVYRLSRDANVRVSLLPPGVYDPALADSEGRVLLPTTLQQATDGEGEPVDHTVEWVGFDPADPNLSGEEGVYTFVIEATDPTDAGLGTVYRGALQLRR